MSETTLSNMLERMNRLSFSNPFIEDQMYSLKEVVKEEDVVLFYPKNYFQVKTFEEVELILIQKGEIVVVSFSEDGSITLLSRKINAIRKVELKHKSRETASLTIDFGEGDTIVLDSHKDNTGKNHQFQEKIIEMYKYLT